MSIFFFFFALLFSLPLNLYPLVDFPKDFLGIAVFLVGGLVVIYKGREKVFYPNSFSLYFLLVCSWLASYLYNYSAGDNWFGYYYIIWSFSGLVIILSASFLVYCKGRVWAFEFFSKAVVFASSAMVFVSLMRHYGALPWLLPWVSESGDRLLGPWGQPNLSALFIFISLISAFYFYNIVVDAKRRFCLSLLVFSLAYCGVLTISRSWYFFLLIASLSFIYILGVRGSRCGGEAFSGVDKTRSTTFMLIFGAACLVAPFLDGMATQKLVEYGFLDRAETSELLSKRANFDSVARINEWGKVLNGLGGLDSFWFGHGLGRYGAFSLTAESSASGGVGYDTLWSHSHNIFLNALVEWGALGLISVLFIFIFLGIRFLKVKPSLVNFCIFSILGAILFHNIVSFSLWYFPFFAIALIYFVFASSVRVFEFSSIFVKRFLLFCSFFILTPVGAVAVNDYYKLSIVFNGGEISHEDRSALQEMKVGSLFGREAYKVEIQKLNPDVKQSDAQREELIEILKIRPEPIFLMRKSVLDAVLSDKNTGCDQVRETVNAFPFVATRMRSELSFLSSVGDGLDVEFYIQCMNIGLIQRGRTPLSYMDAVQ